MPTIHNPSLDIFLVIAALYVVKRLIDMTLNWRNGSPPPGPKGYPIIGNLYDMPTGPEGPHWAKHKDLYGKISSVKIFGQTIVILNDMRIAFELLDKRSMKYSNRPKLVFYGELCGRHHSLAFSQYGEYLRAGRKMFHRFMGTRALVSQYAPLQELESRRFLLRTMRNSNKFVKHIQTEAGAIILKLSYGYNIKPEGEDPLIILQSIQQERFSLASQPGTWIVDILPFMKHLPEWFPGAGFQKTARETREEFSKVLNVPYNFVKAQIAEGVAVPSFASENLEAVNNKNEERLLKWTVQAMYGGGSDTTVAALSAFFLAMTLYPTVLSHAQAEVDAVIGTDRLPRLSDRPKLPYIDAILKETLRWMPVTPSGLPHATSEGDHYEKYFIPKGSIIVPNIWQFSRDPEVYHDPGVFNPSRFLGENPEFDPHGIAFGFGRRICPGKELADTSMFITIAQTIAVFDIKKAKDDDGREIQPSFEFTSGTISHPKKFPCTILPRSRKAAGLIEAVEEEHPFEPVDAGKLIIK